MWWDDDFVIDEEKARTYTFREMLVRVMPYVRPYSKTFLWALLWALIGVLLVLFQPLILKQIIDKDIPSGDFSKVAISASLYLAVMIFSGIVGFYSNWMAQRAGIYAVNDLKVALFNHTLKLGIPFLESIPIGKLVSRIESDPQRIIAVTSTMAQRLLMSFGMIIGALVILASVDIRFLLITIVIFPVVIGGAWFSFKMLRPYYRKDRENYSKMLGVVSEFVRSAGILQMFNRVKWAMQRVDDSTEKFNRFSIKMSYINYGIFNGLGFMEILATVIALSFGVRWIEEGSITVGSLVLFAQYIAQIYWPIFMFTEQLSQLQSAGGSADRIFSTMETEPEIQSPPHPVDIPKTIESISFENVCFEYEANKPILKNISFHVDGGQQVAFVGPTGGGKSTIITLLCRFRDPQEGRICINGIDIKEFDLNEYRKWFGLVLQDLFLFPAPIYENLRAFREEINEEKWTESARQTGIHETILSKDAAYETILDEGGEGFSYGQRQLLAFARALSVSPKILVLDEATSSVDPGTEQRIQKTLTTLITGRTSFIVAHRLSTIQKVNQIFFIQSGAIMENGDHQSLMSKKGSYYHLVTHGEQRGETI